MTRLDIYFDFLLILLSEKPSALFDFTNPDWAPTLNLGHAKVTLPDISALSTGRNVTEPALPQLP